jgi:putative copper export protein
VVDFAHQSAALWSGGLLPLVVALFSLRRGAADPAARGRIAADWVTRWAWPRPAWCWARAGAGAQVQSWNALLLTTYGQTLLLKLLVVALALAAGAYNSLGTLRRLAAAPAGQTGRPAGRVAVEAALVAVILFAAAWLVDLPPAGTALGASNSRPAAEAELPFEWPQARLTSPAASARRSWARTCTP